MKKNILINAANLHVGGGVQVAVSFIYEMTKFDKHNFSNINIIVSTEVNQGLSQLNANISIFKSYRVIDFFGIKTFFSSLNKEIKKYDLIFSIFGPNYLRSKAKTEIVGFAQSWIVNFNNPISKKMSFFSRNILRAKFLLQWIFFLRAHHYIVELEHVKNRLIKSKGINESKISIVYNTVSSLYNNKDQWSPIIIDKVKEAIALGIVTRDYPHKNINILPVVADILEKKHNLKVHFYVTLNDLEWSTKDVFFKKYISNVGSLSPNQCPSFYEQIDGVVFPSLLECFSATPLEAMVMKKPLFASDRGFVQDICANYAIYFDPLEAEDIASKIAFYYKTKKDRTEQLQQARYHALNFSTAKGRAEQYLKIIQQHLKD